MRKLCDQIQYDYTLQEGSYSVTAEKLIVQYLLVDPLFKPAQHLRLFPVLPFGLCSVAQIASEQRRGDGVMICTCDPGEYTPISGHKLVVDNGRLSSDMKDVLKRHFGPLKEVSWSDDAMESPEAAGGGTLSALERRFQESLTLLSGGSVIKSSDAFAAAVRQGIKSGKNISAAIGEAVADFSGDYGPRSHPDLPDIRFKLTRLTRLDGKTPVTGIRFQIQGTRVLLNLNNEDIRAHLAFAEKDPDLAAHWCLRELILSDRLSCFKHLSYEACEMLVHSDAVARLGQPEPSEGGAAKRPGKKEKNYWNDDSRDWNRFLDE